jgi:hypothetical protein
MITSSSSNNRVFLIFPENRSFLLTKTTRPAFRERSRQLIAEWVVIFVVSAIALFMLLVPMWKNWHDRRTHSVDTDGQLLRHKELSGGQREALYRFKVGDSVYTGWQVLTPTEYEYALAHRDALPVRYLSTNPETSWINNTLHDDPRWRDVGTALGGGWLLLAGGIVIVAAGARNRNTQLAQTGKLIRGEILDCAVNQDDPIQVKLRLRYKFISPESGREIVKTENIIRPSDREPVCTDPGMKVAVLYRNDRHFTAL